MYTLSNDPRAVLSNQSALVHLHREIEVVGAYTVACMTSQLPSSMQSELEDGDKLGGACAFLASDSLFPEKECTSTYVMDTRGGRKRAGISRIHATLRVGGR